MYIQEVQKMSEDGWKTFEATGDVKDYLRFCQKREEEQKDSRKDNGTESMRDRDRVTGGTSGRL